jgi:hypothetical protein
MDKERMETLLKRAKEDKRIFEGYSASSDYKTPGIVKNINPKAGGQGRWVKPTVNAQYDFNLPRLIKRSPNERVESLARKLMDSVKQHRPGETAIILQQMSEEGWKQGSPVSYEEVKRVAIEAMRKAAGQQAEEQRKTF